MRVPHVQFQNVKIVYSPLSAAICSSEDEGLLAHPLLTRPQILTKEIATFLQLAPFYQKKVAEVIYPAALYTLDMTQFRALTLRGEADLSSCVYVVNIFWPDGW